MSRRIARRAYRALSSGPVWLAILATTMATQLLAASLGGPLAQELLGVAEVGLLVGLCVGVRLGEEGMTDRMQRSLYGELTEVLERIERHPMHQRVLERERARDN